MPAWPISKIPSINLERLTEIVPGPDFPTGALLIGKQNARAALARGRGSILMRARCAVEEIRKDREAIIVTELPYQVNKAMLIERIAELVRDKRIEGISDIRDESDRSGMRMVIELKRDASSEVVLNQLYRFSSLQQSFGVNMLALNDGRPVQMNLKELLAAFVGFREEVVTRRTKFDLTKARDRGHILVGLAVAVANIDEVIRLIRAAPDAASGARAVDGAGLAGQGCRPAGGADRRSAPSRGSGRHHPPVRRTGQGDPGPAPAAPDRAGPRRNQ